MWKPSQLCGRSSVLLCGNYPTYVASQQFVPYCPSYSFLPPRSMCALPQFVLIPCFPSCGERIQTMEHLNIWLTTNMFVILLSDFHTHMTSHYCLPREFESQYKSDPELFLMYNTCFFGRLYFCLKPCPLVQPPLSPQEPSTVLTKVCIHSDRSIFST